MTAGVGAAMLGLRVSAIGSSISDLLIQDSVTVEARKSKCGLCMV